RQTVDTSNKLKASMQKRAKQFSGLVKRGRTHLMDANRVTLGAEFDQYAYSLKQARAVRVQAMDRLAYVGLGGTAVGTGANAPKGYRRLAIKNLSRISGLDMKASGNMFYSLTRKFDCSNCSSIIQ